jgi:FlaA1/EpsC-like NDP-sugar epimerase
MLRSPRSLAKNICVLAFEGAAAGCSLYLAVNFAFGRGPTLVELPSPETTAMYALAFGAIGAVMAYSQSLHRSIWRFTSLFDVLAILRATTMTIVVFMPVAFVTTRGQDLPRSSLIIAWFLTVLFSCAPRLAARRGPIARRRFRWSRRLGRMRIPIRSPS